MADAFKKQLRWNLLLLLGALAVLIGGLYWSLGRIEDLNGTIGTQRVLLFRYAHISEILAQLKTAAPIAKKYDDLMETLLPRSEQLLDFPIWLKGLAVSHQLSADFQFQGEPVAAAGATAGYAIFNITTNGNFDNTIAFLKDLEIKVPRYLVSVDKYDVVRNGDSYQFSIRGRVFFQ